MSAGEPAFWWRKLGAAGLAAACLWPVAAAYGAIAALRLRKPGVSANVPVICVGNFTLGGAGKTPTAIAIARILSEARQTPVLLSRGYGGAVTGPELVDPARHAAAQTGDEPLLLAREAATVICRDRVAGARFAEQAGATVIVLDDGLQNPSLRKTLSLAVIDGARGLGNGRVFPAGPLRAPLAAQLPLIDALLVVGDGGGAKDVIAAASARGARIFHAALTADRAVLAALSGRKVLAFAGIGHPEKFFTTLAAAGIDVRLRRPFPDHHRYSRQEADELIAQAGAQGLELVTTEKDLARMAGDPALSALAARTKPLPVAMTFRDAGEFRAFILSGIRKK